MQDYSQVLSKENDFQVYPVESVFQLELVLSVTFFAYVQLAHSSSGDWKVTHDVYNLRRVSRYVTSILEVQCLRISLHNTMRSWTWK